MNERHERILAILNREKEISVNKLSHILNVSLVTIRSDLRILEEQKFLIRNHGGARLPSSDDISHRMSINYSIKQKIAFAAAEMVHDGDTILLEAGSCVALMARELTAKRNLNVITNNAYIARQLKDSSGSNIILMGGYYQKESETMVGPMVREYLSFYNFTKVFLGMDGFTMEKGPMCRDLDRAEIMGEFVKRSEQVYILSDSGKMGKTAVKTICSTEDVDCIISDRGVNADYREYMRKSNIQLILV